MADLLSIAPVTDSVDVGGGQLVTVHGVSLEALVPLLTRFPDLLSLFSSGGSKDIDINKLAPPLAAAVCAAGSAPPADAEKAEAVAATLPFGVQAEMIAKIFRLTFPGGLGPFVALVENLTSSINSSLPGVSASLSAEPAAPSLPN